MKLEKKKAHDECDMRDEVTAIIEILLYLV